MQSFKEFITKDILHEASLGRFYQHYDKGEPILFITASRGDVVSKDEINKIKETYRKNHPNIAEKEFERVTDKLISEKNAKRNKPRNKEMRDRYIKSSQFGYIKVDGFYQEKEMEFPSIEDSTIVFGYMSRRDELFKLGMSLAKKYNQDSFLFIENKVATLYDKNGSKINEFKNFHPNKLADAMTILKGKKITFDSVVMEQFEQSLPTGFISGLALTPFRNLLRNVDCKDPVAEYDKGEINMQSFKEFINENKSTRLKSLVYGKYNKQDKQGNLVKTFGIITPENPNATPAPSAKINAEYRKLFEKDLEHLTLTFDKVRGKYGSNTGSPANEISYIITNISSNQLKALASRYHQQSVIFATIEDNNIIYKFFATDYIWKELPVVEDEKSQVTTYRLKDTHKTIQTKFDDNNNFTKFKSFKFNIPFSIFEDINNCIDRRNEELNDILNTRDDINMKMLHEYIDVAISNDYTYGRYSVQHVARRRIFSKAKFDKNRHPRSIGD